MNLETLLVNSYCRELPTKRAALSKLSHVTTFDGSSYVLGSVLSRVRKQDKVPYPTWSPFCGLWMTTKGYLNKATGDASPILKRSRQPTDWQQSSTLNGFAYQSMSTLRSKLEAVNVYQALVPRLSKNHGNLLAPMLRNPDLRTDSIFVDVQDSRKITGLIDWQGSGVVPAYKQIQQPPFHGASNSDGLKPKETFKGSTQTIFELFTSLAVASSPDITDQLAFRDSIAYTLLEEAENMLTTDSTDYLALAEGYREIYVKNFSSRNQSLGAAARRWRNSNKNKKPMQECINERLNPQREKDLAKAGKQKTYHGVEVLF